MSIVVKRLDGLRWQRHGGGLWSRPHCARWGPSSPPKKRGRAPQFSAHLYCGQMAGCINMPLGMEVGLSPGDYVLHGDPVPPPQKGAEPPIFGPCLLWPNSCMDQDATWYRRRPRPTRHCARWGSSSPPLKGHAPQSKIKSNQNQSVTHRSVQAKNRNRRCERRLLSP